MSHDENRQYGHGERRQGKLADGENTAKHGVRLNERRPRRHKDQCYDEYQEYDEAKRKAAGAERELLLPDFSRNPYYYILQNTHRADGGTIDTSKEQGENENYDKCHDAHSHDGRDNLEFTYPTNIFGRKKCAGSKEEKDYSDEEYCCNDYSYFSQHSSIFGKCFFSPRFFYWGSDPCANFLHIFSEREVEGEFPVAISELMLRQRSCSPRVYSCNAGMFKVDEKVGIA